MKQKPWDRYEAALLLSYCLKIEAGDIPRKEAVDIVSNTLRKRAEVQGVEIDETFRNTNGISMQMSAIRNCYLGKDHGLAGSKLFHEMVDLYKSNHDALEQILQGESDKVNRSIWQGFLLWLKEAVPDKEKEIVTSLAAVSMLALKSNRTHMPISEISDVAEIKRLQSIMRKPGALGLHSKKMLTKASHALNTYVQFLDKKADDAAAPEESQSVSVEESVVHANFRVDFSKSISYAHTKPIASIVGMAVALKKNCRTMQETSTKLQAMDHAFIDVLHEANVDFIRNGSVSKSPGIISVSIRNISGEMLLHRLDLKGISISTGSACDSVNTQVSHVIKAIGVPSAYAQGTIRISFGHDNQIEDAVEIAHAIAKILQT